MSLTDAARAAGLASVPRHVAIIMDGNNRWAKKRLMPGPAGHRAGVEAIRKILTAAQTYGIEVVTLFAFSSENWRRPSREVEALMSLFLTYLEREVRDLHRQGVRVRVIGERSRFSEKLCQRIEDAELLTCHNTRTTLVIAADYGGQWDMAQAARQLAADVLAGKLSVDEIDAHAISQRVCLSDLPLPDLMVRTGGEHRVSNFLLWQLAYAEFYFTETLWPDFDESALLAAVKDYAGRQRRFGRTSEQVSGDSDA